MTAEQEKQIADIRAVDYHETSGVGKLLAIIDDLQKQQPKRYTEAELRAEFEQHEKLNWTEANHKKAMQREAGGYVITSVHFGFCGWLSAFRFLGMIKTEVES